MFARQSSWSASLPWAKVAAFVAALLLALVIPNLGLPQAVTGPLVNAVLILTVEYVGLTGAILLGMATPLSAATHGVLPLPLLAMIPFIALGNASYVSVYQALRKTHRGLAIVAAALIKFGLLYGAVTLLAARPLSLTLGGATQALVLPKAIISMMQWPQLATALAGGLIALGINGLARRKAR